MGFTKGFHQRGSGGGGSNIELSDSVNSSSTTTAASSFAVKTVNDKVSGKADIIHNHNDTYYQKSEIDNSINTLANSLYTVKANEGDEPSYLSNKVDNVTLTFEGSELRVKHVDGLTIGVADISRWLSGTSKNIQSQIDGINESLLALTAGMEYLGKIGTYADLESVGNKKNGNLVVVLADESRSGGRSMYVYSEDKGMWEFIGEFTFTDEFLALKDTPTSYEGADGKVVKVAGERLVFGDVDYGNLLNKPKSTITQIDDSVAKKHEHSNLQLLETYTQTNVDLIKAVTDSHVHPNKSSLDRLGINASNKLTIDGSEPQKSYFSGYVDVNQTVGMNELIKFKNSHSRNIGYDSDTGVFTLEIGKTYYYVVNMSADVRERSVFRLVKAATKSGIYPLAEITSKHNTDNKMSSGSLSGIVTPSDVTEYGIAFEPGRSSSKDQNMTVNREYTHIVIYEI